MMKEVGYSDNEIREFEDALPYDGGDERYAPLNQIPKSREQEYLDAKIVSLEKGADKMNNPEGENKDTQN
jgi:hypothetical protein